MRTRVSERFGIEFPIVAFNHCRDVVAAVSRAGGLGVLGALYYTPDELETELRWLDEHTGGRPYGVDVVMPASYTGADLAGAAGASGAAAGQARAAFEAKLAELIPAEHRRFVSETLDRFGVPALPEAAGADGGRRLLGWTDATARPQVEVALSHPIALLANALGPPPPDVVEQAHAAGVPVAALVSSAHHAGRQVEAGVDLIVAQGTEAGGHTGDISTMVLVPEVVDAVAPTPVLAAGGIGNGRQVAASLALGAEGVWTGSVWLTVAESDTSPMVRDKLLAATSRDTVRSRSMTGKPARMLRTAWTDAWEGPDSPGTLPMPLQFMLTAEALRRIGRSGNRDLAGTPVGQIVGSMTKVRPAAEVIYDWVREYAEAVGRLDALAPD
jgi:NAD(P)H-dependent flavin oxidoreductase YrpB (nitropropane dioxygenase family)